MCTYKHRQCERVCLILRSKKFPPEKQKKPNKSLKKGMPWLNLKISKGHFLSFEEQMGKFTVGAKNPCLGD